MGFGTNNGFASGGGGGTNNVLNGSVKGETLYWETATSKWTPNDVLFVDIANLIAFIKNNLANGSKLVVGEVNGIANGNYAGAFGLTKSNIIRLNLSTNVIHSFELFTDTTTSNGYIGVRGNLQFLHALQGLIYEYSTTDPEAVGSGINIFNNKVRINETLRLNEGFIVPNTTDSCSGVAKLTNGQVIVPHNEVEANSKIFVSYRAISGTIGVHLVALSADVSGTTQFIIKSLDSSGSVEIGDQSDVSYFIIRTP
jgi:hypothetical protein